MALKCCIVVGFKKIKFLAKAWLQTRETQLRENQYNHQIREQQLQTRETDLQEKTQEFNIRAKELVTSEPALKRKNVSFKLME